MTIEAAQYISDLNASYPRATDLLREGDDHIRMVKNTLQRTFPNINGATQISTAKLNAIDSAVSADSSGFVFSQAVAVNANLNVRDSLRGGAIYTNGSMNAGNIELSSGSPFIDFHYGNNAGDYTARIIADNDNRLNVSSNFHVDGEIASDKTITGANINTGGRVTSSGGIYAARVFCNNVDDASQQGVSLGWNNPPGSGRARLSVNPGSGVGGITFDMVNSANNAVTGNMSLDASGNFFASRKIQAGTDLGVNGNAMVGGSIQGGYLNSFGDIRANSSLICENGAVYSGGVNGAFMAHDGNIHGVQWGNDYLSNYINSENNFFHTAGGRVKGWDTPGNQTVTFRVDGQGYFLTITASDERLKSNIKDADPKEALKIINDLELKSFDIKLFKQGGTDHHNFGFIAQQAEKIGADFIHSADEGSYKQINPTALYGTLIGAIQALSKEVEELKAKLEA